jgi:hypothetical protein
VSVWAWIGVAFGVVSTLWTLRTAILDHREMKRTRAEFEKTQLFREMEKRKQEKKEKKDKKERRR